MYVLFLDSELGLDYKFCKLMKKNLKVIYAIIPCNISMVTWTKDYTLCLKIHETEYHVNLVTWTKWGVLCSIWRLMQFIIVLVLFCSVVEQIDFKMIPIEKCFSIVRTQDIHYQWPVCKWGDSIIEGHAGIEAMYWSAGLEGASVSLCWWVSHY